MAFHFLSVREMDGTERESGTNTEGDSCYNLKQTFFCTFYPAPLSYLIVLSLQTMNPDHCKKKKNKQVWTSESQVNITETVDVSETVPGGHDAGQEIRAL